MDPRDPVQPLTDRTFDAFVGQSEVPVVVELYAEWDPPWRALDERQRRQAARELGARVRWGALETQANRMIATRHGVETIPELLVFARGRVVARHIGRTEALALRASLERALRASAEHDAACAEVCESPAAELPQTRVLPLRKKAG